MTRSLKTDALVVGSMRYGEADRILTLYTRERGRLSAIAKGVRRVRSKTGGRIEPFSLVHTILYPGRSLYTVTAVETIRTFQGVRDELFRMEQGARLLESVRRLFPEEEASPAAFNLLVRGVARLAVAPDVAVASRVVLAVRVKLLLALGYLPQLDSCVACGREDLLCGFDPSLGGVLCSECFQESPECFLLSAEAYAALRDLLDRPLNEVEDAPLDEPTVRQVELTLIRVLAHHAH